MGLQRIFVRLRANRGRLQREFGQRHNRLIGGIVLGVCCGSVFAQSLPELWSRALASEPTLLAAKAQVDAAEERQWQALAQFLPQITYAGNKYNNDRLYRQTGAFAATYDERYKSTSSQFNLTQAIIRAGNHVAHRQAQAGLRQATQQLAATRQDVLAKLVAAWAEVLYAQEALKTAVAMEQAASQQDTTYDRGHALGMYSVNQRDEAKAKHQQAIAERFAAESELLARHSALEQLVGPASPLGGEPMSLETEKIALASTQPLSVYTEQIESTNPNVLAAREALKVAQEEVRKQNAQHAPTLDLVATSGRTGQPETGTTPNQPGYRSRVNSVGFQVNLPIFSGGAQSSKVREAQALASKAEYELDSAIRSAHNQARQAWAQVRASGAKFEAAKYGLIAAQSGHRAAVLGQKNGSRTPFDELQAQHQIETAQRDAHRAYYDNVIGMARLLAAVGALDESALEDFDRRRRAPSSNVAETPRAETQWSGDGR